MTEESTEVKAEVKETQSHSQSKQCRTRPDVIAWLVSMVFIILLLVTMWISGNARGWNAQSGYHYEEVKNTQERFMPEPFHCNETSIPGRSGEACTGAWYFWKLPPNQATALSRAIMWLCYCLHQLFVWGLIYRAQLLKSISTDKRTTPKYGTSLNKSNWMLLGVNALFHILHLAQTHWTYDGLAQDVSVSSSQSSVIMMICFIILMEYRDRGFILMWPNPRSDDRVAKYLRLSPGPIQLIRKYHGFAFSWATIYTFWYHPMENTWGHAMGFFHTAIVMLQGSLIYTEMHLNRYWRLLNETWVLLHATVVAVQVGNPDVAGGSTQWPLFAFGFGFVFAFTQVFSFPFWKKISAWFRIIPVVIFFTVVTALSATVIQGRRPGETGFSRMYEMVFIPAEEYGMFFISWLFLYVFLYIEEALIGSKKSDENPEASATKQAAYVCGVVLIYAVFIVISHVARYIPVNFTILMIVYVFIFMLGVCITIMFFKQLMGPFRKLTKTKKVACDENKSQSPPAVPGENDVAISGSNV